LDCAAVVTINIPVLLVQLITTDISIAYCKLDYCNFLLQSSKLKPE